MSQLSLELGFRRPVQPPSLPGSVSQFLILYNMLSCLYHYCSIHLNFEQVPVVRPWLPDGP